MMSPSSSSSMFSEESRRHVLSCLPADSQTLATASARVYHRPFNGRPENWTYSGLSGTLIFGRNQFTTQPDKKLGPGIGFDQTFWFRLVEPVKGLVWLHQIPDIFDYSSDKPFFHQFSGKSRMFGFRFDEDVEATMFLRKVTSSVNIKASTMRKRNDRAPSKRRLSPSMVSGPAPGTFVHVAHVGFDATGRIEMSEHISPEWTRMLKELQGFGLPKQVIDKEHDFIEGFWAGVKAVHSSPASESATLSSADAPSYRDNNARRKSSI